MARRNRRFQWQGARRFFSRGGMKAAYRGGGGSVIFGVGGAAAGYLAPRFHPLQDMLMTGLAVLPGVLPMGRAVPWQLRRFASGYVLGTMARSFIAPPNVLGSVSQGGDFV